MKQRIAQLIVCAIAAFLVGCAQPCFYQAGKSLEECRRDLRLCFMFGQPALCMQSKGYQFVDARKLPQGRERIKVVSRFGQFWIMDGRGMNPESQRVSPGQLKADDLDQSEGRIVEYRVERGDLGTFKITLVYEDGQK